MAGNPLTSPEPDTDRKRLTGWFDGSLFGLPVGSSPFAAAGIPYPLRLEMTAIRVSPERSGGLPTRTVGPSPEILADERVFDRHRVADPGNGVIWRSET